MRMLSCIYSLVIDYVDSQIGSLICIILLLLDGRNDWMCERVYAEKNRKAEYSLILIENYMCVQKLKTVHGNCFGLHAIQNFQVKPYTGMCVCALMTRSWLRLFLLHSPSFSSQTIRSHSCRRIFS